MTKHRYTSQAKLKLCNTLHYSAILKTALRTRFDKSTWPYHVNEDRKIYVVRTECREDAGAAVSDKQMRSAVTPYPVDRYLVESRKQTDMVNIIDDDIWNPEPALRPEDEILLRKLHVMLQTTADDLKLLSGELSKYHEPGLQVKTLPMPLDEEFNEKIHIEEVVNAKFYGNKIVDTAQTAPNMPEEVTSTLRSINNIIKGKNTSNTKANNSAMLKKLPVKKNLQISRTNIVEIKEKPDDKKRTEKNAKQNIYHASKCNASPTVAYNEVFHKYIKPDVKLTPQKSLQIQEMPGINIRSELRLQNVLQIDILPDSEETNTKQPVQQNALVIEMQHVPPLIQKEMNTIKFDSSQYISAATDKRPAIRRVSTMKAYESSESNNVSSDFQNKSHEELHSSTNSRRSTNLSVRNNRKSNTAKRVSSRPQAYLAEWKRKLNTVYGKPPTTKTSQVKDKKVSSKNFCNKPSSGTARENKQPNFRNQTTPSLNNVEYIPYSKLTLGGVNVSDIERELYNIPNNNNIVLSPILDKILSSRENSFHGDSPKKASQIKSSKVLTTSDENLLQEVLDIEMKVTHTLNNNKNSSKISGEIKHNVNDDTKDDSYADDFDDEKSDASTHSQKSKSETSKSSHNSLSEYSCPGDIKRPDDATEENNKINDSNLTFTKARSLSFKNEVDIFEFVHSVDTRETGTQSNTSSKIAPKETQTSPRNDKLNVQPIHNDLWPTIDPKQEVEKMLKLEKEFIKKLIIDEYGDLLEKSLNKPSTSEITETEKSGRNIAASQKITQTSPAHVKSVMTSPTKTKTRTTSPLALSMTTCQQTSPVFPITNEDEFRIDLQNNDLGISTNLSSPRFSLRLPQTSRDVLSKLEIRAQKNKHNAKYENLQKNIFSSSSSVDGDYSSSDISSLGEINKKFKRLRKSRILSISEISSTSSQSKYNSDPLGAILPLKSEGEASMEQTNRKKTNKNSKSEGEVSLGQQH